MEVLGKQVDMPSISCDELESLGVPDHGICKQIFAHNCVYSGEKIARDVPEFRPRVSLAEGIRSVYDHMVKTDRIPESRQGGWEDVIVNHR